MTADEAFELSRVFRELAKNVGDRQIADWKTLTPQQRQSLENEEWDLLNAAISLRTAAVGLVLDETETSVAGIIRVTNKAKKAVKTLDNVRTAISIAATAVTLAAAILAKDPQAIAKNAAALYEEIKEATA